MEEWTSRLSSKKRYLQVALNSTLEDAFHIITQLPISDRIIIEAGTPLIKRYGEDGIHKIKSWYSQHIAGTPMMAPGQTTQRGIGQISLFSYLAKIKEQKARMNTFRRASSIGVHIPATTSNEHPLPYVVADLKMMDRGKTEVEIAARGGADAAVALGHAPTESLNAFIATCEALRIDAMIDMMNVEYPLAVLHRLKKQPRVVILHRGVDETEDNKEKMLPLYEIRRIKGAYDMMISIAGGDTLREVQSSFFNDADIAVVWKNFYHADGNISALAQGFLDEIK